MRTNRWIRGDPLEADGDLPVDQRQKCWVVQGYPQGGPEDCGSEARIDRWGWPDAMPAFLPNVTRGLPGPYVSVLLAAPGGDLLIRRAPQVSAPVARYDLVDRTGSLKATLRLPAREAIVGFGEESVYTIRMDEFDLQWLRRHPWPWE